MERCFRDELLRRVQLPDQHLLRVGRQVRNRRPNIGEILPQARSPGTLALLPSEVGVVEKVFDGRAFRRISNEASLDDVDDERVVVLGFHFLLHAELKDRAKAGFQMLVL